MNFHTHTRSIETQMKDNDHLSCLCVSSISKPHRMYQQKFSLSCHCVCHSFSFLLISIAMRARNREEGRDHLLLSTCIPKSEDETKRRTYQHRRSDRLDRLPAQRVRPLLHLWSINATATRSGRSVKTIVSLAPLMSVSIPSRDPARAS